MTPTRMRSARGEGSQLRDEVVAAAEELMLRTGSDEAVSIRDIAAKVGVTPPSIYRHFPDKRALIMAVCEKQFSAFNEAMAKALRNARDPLQELRAMGSTYIDFGLAHPEAYVVMFMRPIDHEAADEPVEQPAAFVGLVSTVQRCIDADLLRADDTHLAAQTIWATVHGLTSLMIAKPDFPWSSLDALKARSLDAAIAPYVVN